jgi:hypothetical protein
MNACRASGCGIGTSSTSLKQVVREDHDDGRGYILRLCRGEIEGRFAAADLIILQPLDDWCGILCQGEWFIDVLCPCG